MSKKTGYPWRPLLVPGLLALLTAFGLLAALLSKGTLEIVAVAAIAAVAALVVVKLVRPTRG